MNERTYVCERCAAAFDHAAEPRQWMAHANFCPRCMEELLARGWAEKTDRDENWRLTEAGEGALPGYRAVAFCPVDGMPIYERWLASGKATKAACPYCLSAEKPFG